MSPSAERDERFILRERFRQKLPFAIVRQVADTDFDPPAWVDAGEIGAFTTRADATLFMRARSTPAPASPVPVGLPRDEREALLRVERAARELSALFDYGGDGRYGTLDGEEVSGSAADVLLRLHDFLNDVTNVREPAVPVGGDGLRELLTSDEREALYWLIQQFLHKWEVHKWREPLRAVAARLSSTTKETPDAV